MKFGVVFILFFLSFPAHSRFFNERWKEFTSPVTTDAKYVTYGGSLVTGILLIDAIEDNFGHDIEDEAVQDEPLGRTSIIGDYAGQMIPNALYFLTAYGLGHFQNKEKYTSRSYHMLKSTFYSALLTTILKHTIREPRPNSEGRDSFPSGHTTTAFAFASVVGTEHEWYWSVPAYTLATLVAFSRINDNDHRLHDVFAGAVIGTSYGLGIYYLDHKDSTLFSKISILPYRDGLFASTRILF